MVVRGEKVPGLEEWEAHQRAVLQAESQLLAGAQPGQTVPGIEQWRAHHRAALAGQNSLQEELEEQEEEQEEGEGSLEPEQRTSMETETRSRSTTATQTGLQSLKRLLSKLKLRQFYTDDGSDNANDDYGENENSKSNKLSILLKKKKQESANSNYLDFLLNSYKQNDEGREIQRSSLFYENYDYDSQSLSERFRFLYEDDSDISLAAKESQQLERSLRRFLSKLDKF